LHEALPVLLRTPRDITMWEPIRADGTPPACWRPQMLGHLGLNVSDLGAAKSYYGAAMPLLGFQEFLSTEDQFAYRPAGGKPGTYLFFYPAFFYPRPRRRFTHGIRPACNIWP
jgi:hypothetical protein